MKLLQKTILFPLLWIVVLSLPNLNGAAQIVDMSAAGGTLQAKWDKTLASGLKKHQRFWMAYSVDRSMAENAYFLSSTKFSGYFQTSSFASSFLNIKGVPLGRQIYGESFKIIPPYEKSEESNHKKITKEVAVLVLYKSGLGKIPAKIRQSNMSFPFENDELPIYWLGKSDENRSLQLLTGIFDNIDSDKKKRYLIFAISSHFGHRQVIPFLAKVVNSDETDTVRGKAAGKLGDIDHLPAVDILYKTAKTDHSLEVRRKAVAALEKLEFPAAVDALIDIAKTANNIYIRQKAINSLGDVGTKKAADALNDIAFKDDDIDIQRKAVYELKSLPNKEGVSYLITIAKTHPRTYIRKKALGYLGNIKDPRAFEAIKSIAKGK